MPCDKYHGLIWPQGMGREEGTEEEGVTELGPKPEAWGKSEGCGRNDPPMYPQ